ncbi:MAG: hypothetical protein HQK60_12985, partial [Deltaproteobacteria bacterium]|nr:hypothetical protein [Deltaproteobacteria bacterium]
FIYRDGLAIAKMVGLTGNQALLSADKFVRRFLGEGCLESIGVIHLLNEPQERHFTPTELGQLHGGITAKQMNKLYFERS